MTITIYAVETDHPAGAPWAGQFRFVVTRNGDGTFYAKHADFGCSKDYPTGLAAIEALAGASGCTVENLCIDYDLAA